MASKRMTLSERLNQKENSQPVDEFFQSTKDININSNKDINVNSNIDNNIESNIESNINNNMNINIDIKKDSKADIKVNIKKDIKKAIKQKPVGYFTYLPVEYIQALEIIKKETKFNKNELAEMAYKLLFKSLGVEIKKQ